MTSEGNVCLLLQNQITSSWLWYLLQPFDKRLPVQNQNIHPDLQRGSQRMLIQTPINQRQSVSHGYYHTAICAPSWPGNARTEAWATAFCSGHFFLDPLVLPKSHNEFRVSTGHAEDRWKKWQKARTGVTARTRGGGRANRAKLIGWARRSVTTSCGSPLSGCCLNSLMEPINKDGVCARSRVQPEETAKQAAAGRGKPAVISKLSVIYWCSFWTKQMSLLSDWVWFLDCSQLFLLAHLWGNVKVKYVIFWC